MFATSCTLLKLLSLCVVCNIETYLVCFYFVTASSSQSLGEPLSKAKVQIVIASSVVYVPGSSKRSPKLAYSWRIGWGWGTIEVALLCDKVVQLVQVNVVCKNVFA